MSKISVIIQARSNSSRLKNKIFKKIGKYTLIEWVIKRVKKSKVKEIILATSKNKNDTKLKEICNKENVKFFSGDEKNVLKRFIDAAKFYNVKTIIRVCADNPFVDPDEINFLIKKFNIAKNKSDYYFNHRNHLSNTYADGFGAELFSTKLLTKIYKKRLSNFHKEHVTSYFWDNLKLFNFEPCKTKIEKKNHTVVSDINTNFDYEKINSFVTMKNIKIIDKANYISNMLKNLKIDFYLKNLFNLNRSLAGEENRKTLSFLNNILKTKIRGFKSGKKVFNWRVPKEWKLKSGYISIQNQKIIDFKNNNLHIASYSKSVNKYFSLKEIEKKIFTHSLKNAIPYRTLYYKNDWAFCASKNDIQKLRKAYFKNKRKKIKAVIDSSFKNGFMNYGEIIIPGKSKKEILISTYICHPSMANDNLSGNILCILLARYIKSLYCPNWSYRIIFIPETIGAISYIEHNLNKLKKINFGLNISCVGGKGKFSFKETWDKNHFLNTLIRKVFKKNNIKIKKSYKFDIHGSDERQFSYNGLGINIASIHKDKFYDFKEYHTSLDNLNFVKSENIVKTFEIYVKIIEEIEKQEIYNLTNKYCEPMLSKLNLYPSTGGGMLPKKNSNKFIDHLLWFLFKTDGKKTLSQIRNELNLENGTINTLKNILLKKKLIKQV